MLMTEEDQNLDAHDKKDQGLSAHKAQQQKVDLRSLTHTPPLSGMGQSIQFNIFSVS